MNPKWIEACQAMSPKWIEAPDEALHSDSLRR